MGDETHPESCTEAEPRTPTFEDVAHICRELNARGAEYVLVGGFAIILHGYPRYTKDVDLLVAVTPENEKRVLDAVATLPDHAASQIVPGQIAQNVVVRVADEVLVDLMRSGCGITYETAAGDAEIKDIQGVPVPVASLQTMWKMKQTLREHDIPDRLFLRQLAEDRGVQLDPPPAPPSPEVAPWAEKLLSWLRNLLRVR